MMSKLTGKTTVARNSKLIRPSIPDVNTSKPHATYSLKIRKPLRSNDGATSSEPLNGLPPDNNCADECDDELELKLIKAPSFDVNRTEKLCEPLDAENVSHMFIGPGPPVDGKSILLPSFL